MGAEDDDVQMTSVVFRWSQLAKGTACKEVMVISEAPQSITQLQIAFGLLESHSLLLQIEHLPHMLGCFPYSACREQGRAAEYIIPILPEHGRLDCEPHSHN